MLNRPPSRLGCLIKLSLLESTDFRLRAMEVLASAHWNQELLSSRWQREMDPLRLSSSSTTRSVWPSSMGSAIKSRRTDFFHRESTSKKYTASVSPNPTTEVTLQDLRPPPGRQ